jgi:hypothetical protein
MLNFAIVFILDCAFPRGSVNARGVRSPEKNCWNFASNEELSFKQRAAGAFFKLIRTTRCLGIAVLFCVGLFVFNSSARGEEKPNKDNHPPIELWLFDQKESETLFAELENLSQHLKVTIRLNNRTGGTIKVQRCNRTCSCISVEMPRDEVKDGEVLEIQLSAVFEKHPKSLEQALGIQLETSGARTYMSINLRGNLTNFLGFQDGRRVLKISPKESTIEADIPVLISKDIDRRRLKVGDSGKMLRSSSFDANDGVSMLQCKFDVPTNAEPTTLEIRDEKDQLLSQCQIEFLSGKWIEFLPSTLAFQPCKPFGDYVKEASGIIKIRAETSDYSTLVALECETDSQLRLPVEWKKVRDGYYRFKVFTVEYDDLKDTKKVTLKYLTPHGRGVESIGFIE